jgi:hypothetical protein
MRAEEQGNLMVNGSKTEKKETEKKKTAKPIVDRLSVRFVRTVGASVRSTHHDYATTWQ